MSGNIFRIFDLTDFTWSTMESSLKFKHALHDDEEDKWATFDRIGFGECRAITCLSNQNVISDHFNHHYGLILMLDNNFVITTADKTSGNLHRVPLGKPFRLLDIAWMRALNSGILNNLNNIKLNLPYSRVF